MQVNVCFYPIYLNLTRKCKHAIHGLQIGGTCMKKFCLARFFCAFHGNHRRFKTTHDDSSLKLFKERKHIHLLKMCCITSSCLVISVTWGFTFKTTFQRCGRGKWNWTVDWFWTSGTNWSKHLSPMNSKKLPNEKGRGNKNYPSRTDSQSWFGSGVLVWFCNSLIKREKVFDFR